MRARKVDIRIGLDAFALLKMPANPFQPVELYLTGNELLIIHMDTSLELMKEVWHKMGLPNSYFFAFCWVKANFTSSPLFIELQIFIADLSRLHAIFFRLSEG